MSAVTVIANLPCLGLRKDQEVTVELTDLIQGALDGGKLSLVSGDHLSLPASTVTEVEVDEDNLDDITEADEAAAMTPPPQGKPRK